MYQNPVWNQTEFIDKGKSKTNQKAKFSSLARSGPLNDVGGICWTGILKHNVTFIRQYDNKGFIDVDYKGTVI